MINADSSAQVDLPINHHRVVGLLKAPKFVADQWKSQSPDSIVGVLVRKSNSNEDTVFVSAESIAAHNAKVVNPQKLLQVEALRKIRSFKTKTTSVERLYLLTHRTPNNRYEEVAQAAIRPGVPSIPGFFAELDLKCPPGHLPISVSKGLTIEGRINQTMTLSPSLDRTYHSFLKARHMQQLSSGRATKESTKTQESQFADQDDRTPRLFRYYQPGAGFSNAVEQDKKKKARARSRNANPDVMAARDDDMKQRLFQAFESRLADGGDGSLTVQDMLKVTGQSHQQLRGLIEQIATPVRSAERKRPAYVLKAEFRQSKRVRGDF